MSRSGYKRGLAYSAVTAMAITGLPFFAGAAEAATLNNQVADADTVELLSFDDTRDISTKPDGQNTTYRLEAIAGANIEQVRFEYSTDAGTTWHEITTVPARNDDGAFAYEWDPNALGAQPAVIIRATGFHVVNNAEIVNDSDDNSASPASIDDTESTVNLNDGSAKGYFDQPYVTDGQNEYDTVVDGTASDSATDINVAFWTAAGYSPDQPITPTTAAGASTTTFKGVVDITGYDFNGDPDEIVFNAENQTSDTEAYTLYEQQITTIKATTASNGQTTGTTDVVTVTVTDQNGKPIAGAQVFSSDDAQNTAVGGPQYTNANGQVQYTQSAGQANDAYYYANTTDNNAYEEGIDKKTAVVQVRQYTPHAGSLEGNSRDGAAFDWDEADVDGDATDADEPHGAQGDGTFEDDGDITVQVKDQNGANYDPTSQDLQYYWLVTPFDTSMEPSRYPGTGTDTVPAAEDNGTGTFTVPLPAAPIESGVDGTYELYAALGGTPTNEYAIASSKVLTVKVGDSNIVFDKASPQRSTSNGSEVVSGRLELDDGTGLPNRPINISVTSANGNAAFDQPTGPDQRSYNTETDANGAFSATLDDPDSNPPSTETDTVTVSTIQWNHNRDSDNANESNSQEVQFVYDASAATFTIADNSTASNNRESAGEIVDLDYCLRTPDDPNTQGDQSRPLSNAEVTLTTDHGYFTADTVDGSGEHADLGQSETYTTDSNGCFTAHMSIGRDAEFDDDGRVNATVTATSGSATDTQTVYFTSENPLNAGELDVTFAGPEYQTTDNLPQAQALLDTVELVVKAYDQFGNRVGNADIDYFDNTSSAEVGGEGNSQGTAFFTDYDNEPDAYAYAYRGVDQLITMTFDARDTSTEDTITINWYDVTVDNSQVTMTSNTGDRANVGDTVTETVTVVDQYGEPVNGYYVEFVRSGPNSQQGDVNYTIRTDEDGVATYNFKGGKAGTARITATVRDVDTDGSKLVPGKQVAQKSDTVQFGSGGGTGGPRVPIVVTLKSPGANGPADDVLNVKTRKLAEGATVKIFRQNMKTGQTRKPAFDTAVLNANGRAHFVAPDLNGRKVTKYIVKVVRTAKTKAGWSNIKGVR